MKTKHNARRQPATTHAEAPSTATKRGAAPKGTNAKGLTRGRRPDRRKPFVL
jgi:hypothetical protein